MKVENRQEKKRRGKIKMDERREREERGIKE